MLQERCDGATAREPFAEVGELSFTNPQRNRSRPATVRSPMRRGMYCAALGSEVFVFTRAGVIFVLFSRLCSVYNVVLGVCRKTNSQSRNAKKEKKTDLTIEVCIRILKSIIF